VPGSSRLRQPGRCSDGGAFNSRESHLARVGHSPTNRSVDAGYSSRCLGYRTTDLQMIVVCANLRVAITAIGQGFRFAIKLAYVCLGLDQDQGRPTATCGLDDHLGARSLSRVAKPRSHWPSIAQLENYATLCQALGGGTEIISDQVASGTPAVPLRSDATTSHNSD
jgi:hypothetical protein